LTLAPHSPSGPFHRGPGVLPLFNEASEDVFGTESVNARLRDVSGFEDPPLISLLQQLREEANRRSASRLLVRGIAQAIAVHLARNYTALGERPMR
jgi:AraC family transcriptional regulator